MVAASKRNIMACIVYIMVLLAFIAGFGGSAVAAQDSGAAAPSPQMQSAATTNLAFPAATLAAIATLVACFV
ncbi:unnamed protein product [Linum trigynum]|uniref:Uncharacterized protein n=1 Tax=Linum trigynum TaxID=586398 RepID=A0AAV2GJ65_9ROSI